MTVSVSAVDSARKYDLVVIGGGPGGYVAAIRAAQLRLRVALVESDELGGVCLNWGCIPTKALIRNAELIDAVRHGHLLGLKVDKIETNYGQAYRRSRDISGRLVKDVQFLLDEHGVTVYKGSGRIITPRLVEVLGPSDPQQLEADNIIIATGSSPAGLPGAAPDGKYLLTYKDALELTQIPNPLVIVGAGPVGLEFAYIFNAYADNITVVESETHVLPDEDVDISIEMEVVLKRHGIRVLTSREVEGVSINAAAPRERKVSLMLKQTESGEPTVLECEAVMVATGRLPNTGRIGLDNVHMQLTEHGYIQVDKSMQTSVPGIYAVGDITGNMALAHVASAQARIAALSIAERTGHYIGDIPQMNYHEVPHYIHTIPQVARAGLSTRQAQVRGYDVVLRKQPFKTSVGLLVGGVADGEFDGFVKFVIDAKSNTLLGVHMIGPNVTELLPAVAARSAFSTSPDRLLDSLRAQASLHWPVHRALGDLEGLSLV